MYNEEQRHLVGLAQFPKFGPVRMARLMKHFPDLKSAFNATTNELIRAGIETKVAEEFMAIKTGINIDRLLDILEKEAIRVITILDDDYPKLLKEIYDPPNILYVRGKLANQNEFALAVVGTRNYTPYGEQAVDFIVKPLAQNRLTIVSGLALGIDTLSHQAALAQGGRTIAVLGTGLDRASIYPSANRYLAEKIISHEGAVISEFPLGTQPLRHNFPLRNRIISGLSRGTLVVEAGEKSGALITARCSLDQNREVFAVPGSIFSSASIGPNNLIKQGARPITKAEEIVEALDLVQINSYIDNNKIIPETAEQKSVLENLSHEPIHINELIRLTNLAASDINATLAIMEIKGMIKNVGQMQFILKR